MRIHPIRHVDLDATQLELSRILDTWDPIGIYHDPRLEEHGFVAEPGEYDDLVVPILAALRDGVTSDRLAELLSEVLREDYGMASSTGPVSVEITEWWGAAS